MHTMLLVGTHIGILLLLFFQRKKNPTVHPGPPYCSGFGCKTYKDCFLTRQIHLPFSFFLFIFVFSFLFFFFFLFFWSGVGLFTKSELSMTQHIFLCICYIICCLEFYLLPIQSSTQASFAEEESPFPTPVGTVRYGRRGCLSFMVVSL